MFNLEDRLLEIYSKYPRKIDKGKGMKLARQKCKTPEKCDLLEKAVQNYAAYVSREGTEKKYMKFFGTFMSNWEDWLEEDPDPNPELNLMGLPFD